jgi:thioesterase domain-containing protein
VLTPDLRDELARRKREILAFLASAGALAREPEAIVPLQGKGSGTPVFAVPGHNGDVFCYRALARCLGEDRPFFGLQPPGADGQGEPLARIEALAAHFAAQLRAFRPEGPYIVAGYCAGGTVAFALAQQLVRDGAAVRLLALFGSPYPSYFRVPTRLALDALAQVERGVRLAAELRGLPWRGKVAFLQAKLAEREAHRAAERARALDPVLSRRARVEQATLDAVRRYRPRAFPGRIVLFLPGPAWMRPGVAALRWRALGAQAEACFGPADASGHDMLHEPHVATFAHLFASRLGIG